VSRVWRDWARVERGHYRYPMYGTVRHAAAGWYGYPLGEPQTTQVMRGPFKTMAAAMSALMPPRIVPGVWTPKRAFHVPGLIEQAERLRLGDSSCVAPSSLVLGMIEALREQEAIMRGMRVGPTQNLPPECRTPTPGGDETP
jgi:hypothetical protein